ncbi:MAG: PLP-dependent transferase [Tannerella sp.]|jgi:O-acetylhomoserine (thiol)-lyase|nr:PLP-dependent transferase [Tannerella sp.]
MDKKNKNFEAKLLNMPYEKPDTYGALSMPVYNSVAFEFKTAKEMEEAFCGLSNDYYYSRIDNPTVRYFENRVKNITDSMSATAVNSGMAAIANVIISIASTGCNIITSPHLFGNTYTFLSSILANFGIEIRFCDLTDLEQVQSLTDDNTCAVFLEIITNPQLEIADLQALSTICHKSGIPLIADTTIIPFCSFDARTFGVDIEIVSSTKYISGGATTVGGLIIDYGIFNWKKSLPLQKWYYNFGKEAFTKRLRREIHRNLGAYMSPQTAYMQSLGLETLQLRYERQAATCLELASLLKKSDKIISVNYTGLKDNRFHEISNKQFGAAPGAMMTIDLASRQACFDFIDKLKIIRRATNLFDNKTLAIHPSSTIFGTFSEEQRKKMDLRQETIRLSIGLESTEDLLADIEQALK